MTGMTATIWVSLGNKRYVGGTVSALDGKDISSGTFTIALTTTASTPPSTGFATPDVSTQGETTADRILLKLVDSSVAAGTYAVWAKVVDNREIEPLLLQWPVVVA
jgi:hypothetical protein